VWIELNGDTNILEVRYSDYLNPTRPSQPSIRVPLDLADILARRNATPIVYPGFTASVRNGGSARHDIVSWSFTNTYAPINQPFGSLGPIPEQNGVLLKDFVGAFHINLFQGQAAGDFQFLDIAQTYKNDDLLVKFVIPRYTVPEILFNMKYKLSGQNPLTVEAERSRLVDIPNSMLVSMSLNFTVPDTVTWARSGTTANGTTNFILQM